MQSPLFSRTGLELFWGHREWRWCFSLVGCDGPISDSGGVKEGTSGCAELCDGLGVGVGVGDCYFAGGGGRRRTEMRVMVCVGVGEGDGGGCAVCVVCVCVCVGLDVMRRVECLGDGWYGVSVQ